MARSSARLEPPRRPRPPTAAELAHAAGKRVADVIAPDLDILYCGINPSLYSAAVGHHFGRPGNRFWPVLHAAGLVPEPLGPFEERRLLEHGQGITNLVARATARAEDLSPDELARGARALARKVRRLRPRVVAVLGVGAYRAAFGVRRAPLGRQDETLGDARLWVLPNPSGRSAHYSFAALVDLFAELGRWVGAVPGAGRGSRPGGSRIGPRARTGVPRRGARH